jgi:hypothetical protein
MGRDMLSNLDHLVLNLKSYVGNSKPKSISWRTDNVMAFENSAFETARVSGEVVVQLFLSQSDLLLGLVYC